MTFTALPAERIVAFDQGDHPCQPRRADGHLEIVREDEVALEQRHVGFNRRHLHRLARLLGDSLEQPLHKKNQRPLVVNRYSSVTRHG